MRFDQEFGGGCKRDGRDLRAPRYLHLDNPNLHERYGNPPPIVSFGLRALPPGAAPVNVVLDAALRKRVIDGIESDLTEYYVDAGVATKMNEALEAHAKAGDYDSITGRYVLAERLTSNLRAISHDRHLRVEFSPFKMPAPHKPTAEDLARMREQMLENN